MPIHQLQSGATVKVTPYLFGPAEANVYLKRDGSAVPIHQVKQVIEGYEHNDLQGHYDELVTGDFKAYEINQYIVRSGSHSLRVRHDKNENNRIMADPAKIDVPTAGKAWRVWFYHDGTGSTGRQIIFDWAHGGDQVEINGGYQWELKGAEIELRVYDSSGNLAAKMSDKSFTASNLPNQQWNYVNLFWNTIGGPATSEDQIGWELVNGATDGVIIDGVGTDDRYPNRDGYYHKVLHNSEMYTYIDDIEYI